MKLDFDLELSSPEAMLGLGVGALVAVIIIVLLLLRNRRPDVTHNTTHITNSPGATVDIDQSRRTNVAVNTAVAVNMQKINHVPAPPPERKRAEPRREHASGSGTNDDASVWLYLAGGAVVLGVYLFARHFDSVAFWSRLGCFAAFSFALLAFVFDLYRRGARVDEIQANFLLSAGATIVAAALLLRAQAQITPDMIAEAAQQPNAIKLVFQLPHAELRSLMIGFMSTVVVCLVALMALLSILRAVMLSWYEDKPLNWFAQVVLRATHGTRPVPFGITAVVFLGGIGAMPYFMS